MISSYLKRFVNPDAQTLRQQGLDRAEAALVRAQVDLERAKAEVEFLKACVRQLRPDKDGACDNSHAFADTQWPSLSRRTEG